MKNSLLFKKLKFVIPALIFFWAQTAFSAVDPPVIRCIAVDSVGYVTITWVPPADPNNEFIEYTLYSSNSVTGPFNQTPILGLGTSSFLDVTLANSSIQYYFIQTVYDDGSGIASSVSSDTAQSMLPIFTAVTDSTCTITWNPVFSPNSVTNASSYTLLRRIGGSGPFTVIATPNYGSETYDDIFKVCTDSIFYRVEMINQLGCTSISAVLVDLFEDNTAPAPVVIDSITVNPATGLIDLEWKPSSSPDTYGYIIYYYEKVTAQYLFLDTIYGRLNTSYTEILPTIDPKLESWKYTVLTFDSCFNPSANTSAGALDHQTLFLKITPNNCDNTVTLDWNQYINWQDLAGYEILASVNGSPFQSVATLTPADTSFTHSKTNSLALYCYKIRAYTTGKLRTSTSNQSCALANSLIIPKKQYFKQITVQDNQSIHISSLTDTTLPAAYYALLRSLEPARNFFEVTRIPFNKEEVIELDDYEASVNETSYYYRIGIIDTCGIITYLSTPASSMLLKGKMDENSLNINLSWNAYTSWDTVNSGVANYSIYQVLDGNRTLLNTVSKLTLDYKFTIANNIEDGAKFCYEIEAREDSGNIFNQADTALSNRVCFTKNLNVFAPNAFRPGGANPIFKPVISFGELASYRMTVFDRWGKTLYETGDIEQGWDGTVNGTDAPFGTYVYFIQVANFTGSTFTKKGSFVLLR